MIRRFRYWQADLSSPRRDYDGPWRTLEARAPGRRLPHRWQQRVLADTTLAPLGCGAPYVIPPDSTGGTSCSIS